MKNIKSIRIFSNENREFTRIIDHNDVKSNITLVKIPKNTILYQGTDFDFDRIRKDRLSSPNREDNVSSDLSNTDDIDKRIYKIALNKNNIDNFYKYYDKRNKGTYFLSSYKTANIYGLDKDYSTIVYGSFIDLNDILHPKQNVEYIYPLYYIAKKCFTIKYKIKNDLYLLNIGDCETIKLIWNLLNNNELFNIFNKSLHEKISSLKYDESKISRKIDNKMEKYKLTKEEIDDFKYYLYLTCANNENINENEEPTILNRVSDHNDDMVLIKLFKILHIYFLTKGIIINGWIYYGSQSFHQEILILNRDFLEITDIYTRNLTKQDKNIPSYENYMKKINNSLIRYTNKSKKNNILHNYIIPNVK